MFLGLNDSLSFFGTSGTLKVIDYVNDFMAGEWLQIVTVDAIRGKGNH